MDTGLGVMGAARNSPSPQTPHSECPPRPSWKADPPGPPADPFCRPLSPPNPCTSIPDDPGRGHPGCLARQHRLLPFGSQHHAVYSRHGWWVCVGSRRGIGDQATDSLERQCRFPQLGESQRGQGGLSTCLLPTPTNRDSHPQKDAALAGF